MSATSSSPKDGTVVDKQPPIEVNRYCVAVASTTRQRCKKLRKYPMGNPQYCYWHQPADTFDFNAPQQVDDRVDERNDTAPSTKQLPPQVEVITPQSTGDDAIGTTEQLGLIHATSLKHALAILQTLQWGRKMSTDGSGSDGCHVVTLQGHSSPTTTSRVVWLDAPGAMTPAALAHFNHQYGTVRFHLACPRVLDANNDDCPSTSNSSTAAAAAAQLFTLKEYQTTSFEKSVSVAAILTATKQQQALKAGNAPVRFQSDGSANLRWTNSAIEEAGKHVHAEVAIEGDRVEFELLKISVVPHWYVPRPIGFVFSCGGHPYWRCVKRHLSRKNRRHGNEASIGSCADCVGFSRSADSKHDCQLRQAATMDSLRDTLEAIKSENGSGCGTVELSSVPLPSTCLCGRHPGSSDTARSEWLPCLRCGYPVCDSCRKPGSPPLCRNYCAKYAAFEAKKTSRCDHQGVPVTCPTCGSVVVRCEDPDCKSVEHCLCQLEATNATDWMPHSAAVPLSSAHRPVIPKEALLYPEQVSVAQSLFDRCVSAFDVTRYSKVQFVVCAPSQVSLKAQTAARLEASAKAAHILGSFRFAQELPTKVLSYVSGADKQVWSTIWASINKQDDTNRTLLVVLQDEAHYGRLEDSEASDALLRQVASSPDALHILISATPYNFLSAEIYDNVELWFPPDDYWTLKKLKETPSLLHSEPKPKGVDCDDTPTIVGYPWSRYWHVEDTPDLDTLCRRYCNKLFHDPVFLEFVVVKKGLVVIRCDTAEEGTDITRQLKDGLEKHRTAMITTLAKNRSNGDALVQSLPSLDVLNATGKLRETFDFSQIPECFSFLILAKRGTMGDTFPKRVFLYDESLRFKTKKEAQNFQLVHQEVGRAFGYYDVEKGEEPMRVIVSPACDRHYKPPTTLEEFETCVEEGTRMSNHRYVRGGEFKPTSRSATEHRLIETERLLPELPLPEQEEQEQQSQEIVGEDGSLPSSPPPRKASQDEEDDTKPQLPFPTAATMTAYMKTRRFVLWANPQCGKTGAVIWFMKLMSDKIANHGGD